MDWEWSSYYGLSDPSNKHSGEWQALTEDGLRCRVYFPSGDHCIDEEWHWLLCGPDYMNTAKRYAKWGVLSSQDFETAEAAQENMELWLESGRKIVKSEHRLDSPAWQYQRGKK